MCFSDAPEQVTPPPPAPAPVETGKLAVKGSEEKTVSKRNAKRKSGKSAFRSDLSLSTGSNGSGLKI